jgi:electron-transferring-flavoprotein dehydrogenase
MGKNRRPSFDWVFRRCIKSVAQPTGPVARRAPEDNRPLFQTPDETPMTPEKSSSSTARAKPWNTTWSSSAPAPAGLSAAIRIKQLAAEKGQDVSVVVLEKGSEPGAHILSGAVMDPKALTELIPDWKEKGAPLHQPVTDDAYVFLSEIRRRARAQLPAAAVSPQPRQLHRQPGQRGALAGRAGRGLGVEIFPGFAAAEVLYNEDGSVKGVATGNMGIGKDGEPTENFQLGMELLGQVHHLCRGRARPPGQAADRALQAGRRTATRRATPSASRSCGRSTPAATQPGFVMHTAGWPMDEHTYGGAFLYHAEDNKVYAAATWWA